MPSCLICLGSNYNREQNLSLARGRLVELFPTIRFARVEETTSLCSHNPDAFLNQLALFRTSRSAEEVVNRLKEIEQRAGRKPEDKQQERICLDVDLLAYDGEILKPEDMNYAHVLRGMKELSFKY
ncbi:MAG: 2-amino-4-hydroxy-6-hydroxymethyldihydropteridine diphosphokinase [Bacteroides sp.]|nr:2-amino-4-hydroxy-6-hydroxymethyldihydropteridine diphosphokinase [Bacteroides sp.]